MAKQSGLIIKYPQPQDYVLGGETAIKGITRTDNWYEWLPKTEKQYTPDFDTLSCTSFSFTNVAETQLNYMIKNELGAEAVKWLTDNGYIEDGKVNLSDRFLAIMSGTTINGNDMRTVAECARLNGLIPEKDFPMGGTDFASYHDKSLITKAMKAKGKEFLKYVNIMWEWSFSDTLLGFHEEAQIEKVLSETPLQIAIPTPATHATTLFKYNPLKKWFKVFDSYDPFYFENSADVYNPQIGMRISVTTKTVPTITPIYNDYTFTALLRYGSTGYDVVQL